MSKVLRRCVFQQCELHMPFIKSNVYNRYYKSEPFKISLYHVNNGMMEEIKVAITVERYKEVRRMHLDSISQRRIATRLLLEMMPEWDVCQYPKNLRALRFKK
ncbi:MAG: hypothetical protein RR709_00910 [Ruthenibacterium sp.]